MSVIRQPLTSLNQLQNLFGKTKPSEIAQQLVYGEKTRMASKKRDQSAKGKQLQTSNLENVKSSQNLKGPDLLLSPEIDERKQNAKSYETNLLKSLIFNRAKDSNETQHKNNRREKNVAQIIYDESSKQRVKQQTSTTDSKLSENSQQWFVQKFIKDFYFHLSQCETVNMTQDYSKIYEADYQLIMIGLGFGESKELWQDFNNGQFILSRNLLIILLAILNIPFQQIPLYLPKENEQIIKAQLFKSDENGNLLLTIQDCAEIHIKYYQLFINTKQQQGNGPRRNIEKSKSPPQVLNLLSNRSREMAIKKKNNLPINEWFAQQEQKKRENIEKLKTSEETTQYKSTSKPIQIDLTSLSKPLKKQQDKSTIDVEFENQQQFCTFSPQINPLKKFPNSTASTQYDINSQAKRMREARVRQKTLEKLKSTGNTTNNESRIQAKMQTEQSMSQEPNKKVKSRPVFLNFPVLYINVKVDDAKTVRLPVFSGDQAQNLAQKFAIDHNLDDSLEERLKDLLEEQMQSVQQL